MLVEVSSHLIAINRRGICNLCGECIQIDRSMDWASTQAKGAKFGILIHSSAQYTTHISVSVLSIIIVLYVCTCNNNKHLSNYIENSLSPLTVCKTAL